MFNSNSSLKSNHIALVYLFKLNNLPKQGKQKHNSSTVLMSN